MDDRQRQYRSFLVRIRGTAHGDTWTWRASVEDVRTHAHWSFATLEQVYAFLEAQTRGAGRDDSPPHATGPHPEAGDGRQ
jgi:hypothetical protein